MACQNVPRYYFDSIFSGPVNVNTSVNMDYRTSSITYSVCTIQ